MKNIAEKLQFLVKTLSEDLQCRVKLRPVTHQTLEQNQDLKDQLNFLEADQDLANFLQLQDYISTEDNQTFPRANLLESLLGEFSPDMKSLGTNPGSAR